MKNHNFLFIISLLIIGMVFMLTGCDALSVTTDISKSFLTENQAFLYFGACVAVFGFVSLFMGNGKTFFICLLVCALLVA